jgi:hypothetical protein
MALQSRDLHPARRGDEVYVYTATGRLLRKERTAALARTLGGYILFRRADLPHALHELVRARADIEANGVVFVDGGRRSRQSVAGGAGSLADSSAVTRALAGVRLSVAAADGAGIRIAQEGRGGRAAGAAGALRAATPLEKVAELFRSAVGRARAGQARRTRSCRVEARHFLELSLTIVNEIPAVAGAGMCGGLLAGAGHEERVALVHPNVGPADAPIGGSVADPGGSFAPAVARNPTTLEDRSRCGDLPQDAIVVARQCCEGQHERERPGVNCGVQAVQLCHPAFPISCPSRLDQALRTVLVIDRRGSDATTRR